MIAANKCRLLGAVCRRETLRQLALRFIVRDGPETVTVSCVIGTSRPLALLVGRSYDKSSVLERSDDQIPRIVGFSSSRIA
jgi:hypothetical protein